MIKTPHANSRRTPILAIVLAPVVLLLLMQLWSQALVPLYRNIWYSDTVLVWRLASDEPAVRIKAARDAGLRRVEGTAVTDELIASLNTDESAEVRKASATSLGQLGSQRPLGEEAIQTLSSLVLTEADTGILSAGIVAVGQSAVENRYPNSVIERIAQISAERDHEWVYPQAVAALGQIGTAQTLPDTVFALMGTRFTDPHHAGERENMANALAQIAKGQPLPVATLDILAAAFDDEPNYRIRKAILNALAYAADDYKPSMALITAATADPDKEVASTARNGLRIVEYNRTLAGKDPLSVAMNTSELVETRLGAMRIIRSTQIDPAAWEQIAALAEDSETRIVVAAVNMLPSMARSADADFDQRVLIPALIRAMSSPDPLVRYAAHGSLSSISRHRPAYLQAADLPAQLEAGANDPDPKVRVVVMVMLLRDDERRAAIIERGMHDPDPYVRANAAGWLALPETLASQRETFIAEALSDPDPDVRRSAATAQQTWESRERAWPVDLWRLWKSGERGKVGLRILIAATVGSPILICAVFLLYFMARFLTYLQQRRWRAIAAIPIMVTWVAASYGMFMLYFMAAHVGNPDAGETAILAGLLWGAIAVYAGLGWGMHYAVRRP